jgi:hypothetical protein
MKDFIPYEQALELKELGFDEPCLGAYYQKELRIVHLESKPTQLDYIILAPLYQQAFRWFRENYKLSGIPTHQSYEIYNLETEECINEVYPIDTYEEAELACLKKLIEIVKNK